MNSVEKARYDMLVAMVVEAAKGSSSIHDVEELAARHNVKISPSVVKSSITVWDDRGLLVISRLANGTVKAAVKRSRFADALGEVLDHLDARIFEVDWHKEEILTDADSSIDIPCPNGWKVFYCERTQRAHAENQTSATVPLPITIQNIFSPADANSIKVESNEGPIAWSNWVNALVALAVGAGGIIATLWVAGKL